MIKFCKTYAWQGIHPDGKRVKGTLLAQDPTAICKQLQHRGIIAYKIARRWKLIATNRSIKPQDIANFSRQLANLLTAGLALLPALGLLVAQYTDKPQIQDVLASLKGYLENGVYLSDALAQYPECFSRFYCSLIRVGEQSGHLDLMLIQLADHQDKLLQLKQKIRRALRYPIGLISVAVFVFSLLMLMVVPQFEQLFRDAGTTLPWLTRWIFGVSGFFQSYFFPLLLLWGFLLVGLFLWRHKLKKWLQYFNSLLLALPWVGKAIQYNLLIQFTRTMGTTLTAGLPMVASLTAAADVVTHTRWKIAILSARNAILDGTSLDQALRTVQLFPPLLLQIVIVGQASGNLGESLQRLADFLDQRMNELINNLTDLLEPALLLFLGGIIGSLIIALYWPLFNLGNVI